MKTKIAANVVTYNRKNLLGNCLNSLINQTYPLDAIYIIDNASTDNTVDYLIENGFVDKPLHPYSEPVEAVKIIPIPRFSGRSVEIHYVRMPENSGSSGGQYEGVKRGYEAGYDWLWLMDDDAEPEEDGLRKLSLFFDTEEISALAPAVRNDNGVDISHRGLIDFKVLFPLIQKPVSIQNYKQKMIEIDMASFVGILVRREVISKIGYPKKEFFIHYDDFEYSIRLKTVGKILLIPESIIYHERASHKISIVGKILFIKHRVIPYEKLWLSYYSVRNMTYLAKKYSTPFKFYKGLLFYLLIRKNILKIMIKTLIICKDNKLKRALFTLLPFVKGIYEDFDNKVPKIFLYGRD